MKINKSVNILLFILVPIVIFGNPSKISTKYLNFQMRKPVLHAYEYRNFPKARQVKIDVNEFRNSQIKKIISKDSISVIITSEKKLNYSETYYYKSNGEISSIIIKENEFSNIYNLLNNDITSNSLEFEVSVYFREKIFKKFNAKFDLSEYPEHVNTLESISLKNLYEFSNLEILNHELLVKENEFVELKKSIIHPVNKDITGFWSEIEEGEPNEESIQYSLKIYEDKIIWPFEQVLDYRKIDKYYIAKNIEGEFIPLEFTLHNDLLNVVFMYKDKRATYTFRKTCQLATYPSWINYKKSQIYACLP